MTPTGNLILHQIQEKTAQMCKREEDIISKNQMAKKARMNTRWIWCTETTQQEDSGQMRKHLEANKAKVKIPQKDTKTKHPENPTET